MSTVGDIYSMIKALTAQEKQELLRLLALEPKAEEELTEPFVYDPSNPSLGLLHDDPELADEIVRMAMHDRETRPWRASGE